MARKRPARPKPPQSAKKSTGVLPRGYQELLREIKERIRSAQIRASDAGADSCPAPTWPMPCLWPEGQLRAGSVVIG